MALGGLLMGKHDRRSHGCGFSLSCVTFITLLYGSTPKGTWKRRGWGWRAWASSVCTAGRAPLCRAVQFTCCRDTSAGWQHELQGHCVWWGLPWSWWETSAKQPLTPLPLCHIFSSLSLFTSVPRLFIPLD